MASSSNYAGMTRSDMSHHLTPPAKRERGKVFTPLVTTLLAGITVVGIIFGAFLAADELTEPTHQIRRVHVTAPR